MVFQMLRVKIFHARFIFQLFQGWGGGVVSLTKEILCFAALFVVFKYMYKRERGRLGAAGFSNPNTVRLPNEPAAVPRKRLPANRRAPSDLATMSRLCKHLIITIKLSINLHYCSHFKR